MVIHSHLSDTEITLDYYIRVVFSCIFRYDNKIVTRTSKRQSNCDTASRCLSHDKKSQAVLPNSFSSFETATKPLRSVTSSALLSLPSIADGFSS